MAARRAGRRLRAGGRVRLPVPASRERCPRPHPRAPRSHFSAANRLLEQDGKQPIDWQIE